MIPSALQYGEYNTSPFGPSQQMFAPKNVTYDPVRSVGIVGTPTSPVSPTTSPISPTPLPTSKTLSVSPTPLPTNDSPTPLPIKGISLSAIRNPLARLNSEAVRATGPHASAYAQNLATYAGGMFQRPNGILNINPFGRNPLEGIGSPNTMLNAALGTALTNPQSENTLFPGFTPEQLTSMGF